MPDFDLLKAQRRVFESALKPLEKLVALALLDHWSRARSTFPSVDRLAHWSGLDRTSVLRALKGLRESGAIVAHDGNGHAPRNGARTHYDLAALMLLQPRPALDGVVAESDRSQGATGGGERPVPVAESDRTGGGERPVPVAESDRKEPTKEPKKEPREGAGPPRSLVRESQQAQAHVLAFRRSFATPPAAMPWPEDFEPNEANREQAARADLDLATEVAKLSAHAQSQGWTRCNWQAELSKWLLNAVRYRKQDADRDAKRAGYRGGDGRKPSPEVEDIMERQRQERLAEELGL